MRHSSRTDCHPNCSRIRGLPGTIDRISRSRRQTSAPTECEQLVDAIERLTDELRVVRDVLDEMREDLNWIVRSDRTTAKQSGHSILKEMSLDPTSDDWGERLHIVRDAGGDVESDQADATERSGSVPPAAPAEPGKLF